MKTWMLALGALAWGSGCVVIEDGDLDRGWVQCGPEDRDIVCQPGTYCSSVQLAICHEGCVSDANCMEHEKCLKDSEDDRVGDCIPAKPDDPEPAPAPRNPCGTCS